MRQGCTKEEVISLAKTMEIKFTVSGPTIGGAKSGINFNPNDPRRDDVLQRWYGAVSPLLKQQYGTGGDLNVDEVKDVIPITEDYGIWHPQEGIVNGHVKPKENEKIHVIGQLRYGVSKVLEDPEYSPNVSAKYTVADMITGYGVAESVRHYYDIFKQSGVQGKSAIIQGWGNVAGAAAYYLAQWGVKIVGIIDRVGGLINEDGFSFEEIRQLFENRDNRQLVSKDMLSFGEANKEIWNLKADIFIPGATSKILTRDQIQSLIGNGLEVISCGANVPFEDDEIFFGDTAHDTDEQIALLPDFIANCGMARVFAYLMQKSDIEISDDAIFNDVSTTISSALEKVHEQNASGKKIASTALEIALNELMKPA